MSIPTNGRRARRRVLAVLTAGAVVAGALATVPAATAARDSGKPEVVGGTPMRAYDAGRYIVVLKDAPAASYDGGVPGFRATRVAPGRPFDARTPAVRAYSQRLEAQQSRVARSAGVRIERSYTTATNAFSARLTAAQASALAADKGVLVLTPDTARSVDTWETPDSLGLSGPDGAWAQEAGSRRNAGQGTVVGIIDSGIWPEAKSFRGNRLTGSPQGRWGVVRAGGNRVYMNKADGGVFLGACETGQRWSLDDCNAKLVGARSYPETYLDIVAPEDRPETEYLSPRDGDGHGTHVGSTAVGSPVKNAVVEDVNFGEVSGMAPGAKIAAYKVCFDDGVEETGDCYTSAILDAIDDAVVDGVDVINMSISGATDTVIDAVEFAFEGATEAGVFVAVSAGNSGPDASTVAHNSPWLTTVAAATHYNFENTVELGDGTRLKGASIASHPVPQTPLVEASTVAAAGADPAEAALCFPDTLDPAQVAGTMVVCTRGVSARVEKSQVVADAGGVAMILVNPTPSSLDADFHAVPTVHLDSDEGATVLDYAAAQGDAATAAFLLGDRTGGEPTPQPQIAGFSSRGPAVANDGDLLKPDISAPGASILAAVAPPSGEGRKFDLYSGTSMSSPHIAGLAAFMFGERTNWTPMQVKSAMMTSARSLRTPSGGASRDAFAQGAGQVTPKKMFDPGLLVVSGPRQWYRFIQGQGFDLGISPLAAKDLNVPSLAHSQVAGSTSFTRRFKATVSGTWRVRVDVPGFAASAPARLRLDKGEAKKLTVGLRVTGAALDTWKKGFLTLQGPTRVRLPIAVKPVVIAAPSEASGTGTDGSVEIPVQVGSEVEVQPSGLAPAVTETGTATNITTGGGDLVTTCFTVPAGATAARFNLDSLDDTADFDLFLVEGCDPNVDVYAEAFAASATGAADESITLEDPAAGPYTVAVDPYSAPQDSASADWVLDQFAVVPAGEGDLTVDPNPLTEATESYTASWTGLTAGTRYLGVMEYAGSPDRTYLTVDTTG